MDGKTFITINGEKLSIMDVFSLMLLLEGFELRESMRNHFGIIEFAASKNIYPEKEQIQEALDELRYDWGMEKSSNFQEWCRKNNVTENSLYLVSRINACQRLILNSFTEEELSQEFKNYVADETIYCLFCLPLSTLEQAKAAMAEIKEEKISFFEAIQIYGDEETTNSGGFFGAVPKIELPNEYVEAISDLKKGQCTGPVMDDGEWSILYLQDVLIPSYIDCRETLKKRLFETQNDYYSARVVPLLS